MREVQRVIQINFGTQYHKIRGFFTNARLPLHMSSPERDNAANAQYRACITEFWEEVKKAFPVP